MCTQAAHPAGSTAFRRWSKVGKEILLPLEGEKKEGMLDYNVSFLLGHYFPDTRDVSLSYRTGMQWY
jgi:hypothetical protein